MDRRSLSLLALGRTLRATGYQFVTVTPTTHHWVASRPTNAPDLRDIFGWNASFWRASIDHQVFDLLVSAAALKAEDNKYRSTVRFASIGSLLFLHSGFPTTEQDAVFFGPDTYRFARLLRQSFAELKFDRPPRIVDIGSGSGAGGIFAAHQLSGSVELVLADINKNALRFSEVNAALNEIPATTTYSDVLDGVEGAFDVIITNPPYLLDDNRRLYRHGGGELGIDLAIRIAEEGLSRLNPGGHLILYAGVPISGGTDPLLKALRPLLKLQASQYRYEEIDPDVFGEELARPEYAHADRIAAVGLTIVKQG
jgi:SAM-dependent methyltransferase